MFTLIFSEVRDKQGMIKVKHDTIEYKIEIWKEYYCFECMDRRWVWKGESDDLIKVRCPWCNYKVH